jgi:eukaryotic-like serine/threonine-protein kinase
VERREVTLPGARVCEPRGEAANSLFHRKWKVARGHFSEVRVGHDYGGTMAREEQSIDVTRDVLVGPCNGQGSETAGGRGARDSSTFPVDPGSGEAPSRTSEPIPPGTRVGRYELVELVGSGGAGRVYRARDPQLERFVALKLLHASSLDGQTRGRLLQEARTLARLSHPNVVAAYDVGVHEGALFVAMEFVDGVSMRDWLAEPRDRVEIVRVLLMAGRGLASAHAANVCHRDFKPANVMIASDGRVRVVDFGLARSGHARSHEQEGAIDRGRGVAPRGPANPEGGGEDAAELALSTGSRLVGTPGFMAPELLCGRAADARSDQFSYAVTAFVALTGALPYPRAPDPHLPGPLTGQRLPWPMKVPRRIRRVIDRGLEAEPKRRFPSLATMVSALERATAPRKRLAWSLVVGAAAAASGLAVAVAHRGERTLCDVDASAFAGVWDTERRSAVERAFQATGRSSQADTFVRIAGRLDAFRDEWLAVRQESCKDGKLSGELSERLPALRTACLDEARAGAKTLVDALSRVTAADVDRVAGAWPPTLRACSDTSALSSPHESPTSGLEAEIAEVEREITALAALIRGGFGSASLEHARLALERARATRHAATIAKATVYMGRSSFAAAGTLEQRNEAEAWLREGMRLAADSGQDLLLAKTASYLFCFLSYSQVRTQESEAMLPMVQAIVARAGNPPEQRIEILMGTAYIELQHQRHHESIAMLEEVRRLAPSAEGEYANYGFLAARDLSHLRMELGEFAAAVQAAQEALDGIRMTYGPGHPRMLFGLSDLAVAQSMAGLRDPALQSIAEARRIATTLPADEPRLKNVARAEGVVWQNLGECERALPPLRNAVGLFTAAHGATHPLTTGMLDHLGICLAATGRSAEAIAAREQSLSNKRTHGGPGIYLAGAAFDLAKELWSDPKQRTRALALIDEANSIWRKEGATQAMDDAASWLAAHRR